MFWQNSACLQYLYNLQNVQPHYNYICNLGKQRHQPSIWEVQAFHMKPVSIFESGNILYENLKLLQQGVEEKGQQVKDSCNKGRLIYI